MVMTGELDLFITGEDVIERYAEQEWFDDLHAIVSESVFEQREKEDRVLSYKGIPIAVKITESKRLSEYYYYNGKQGVELYAAFPARGCKSRIRN